MYKMNTKMLLAIVATTAVLTMMTSSIGVGIFSQHANANPAGAPCGNGNGASVLRGGPPSPLNCEGNTCTINGYGSNPSVTTGNPKGFHAVVTPNGGITLQCHS